MFDRVVVPVDGSPGSFRAVVAGSRLAASNRARLEVLTVVDPPADRRAEEAHLRERLGELGALPCPPEPVVLAGDLASHAVEKYLTDGPPTQLVMSSTGRGRSAAVLGSVAEELLSAGLGSIVVVGPHADPHRIAAIDVLVTLDGSKLSERALDVAAQWCATTGGRPWVVSVLAANAAQSRGADVSESMYVKRQAERLQDRLGRVAEYEVLHGGSPAEAIAAYADSIGAGLIVMCTHGRSGLRRLVMGSVAADVIRKATCPVLLDRPSSVDPTEVAP